jgi:hypothetical protein
MSSTTEAYESELDSDDDDKVVTLSRKQIRALEKKAKERDELAKQVETFTRNDVFKEAGIDPKDPKQQYFVKGYDGEVTVDAIRAAATEAGYLAAPEPSAEQLAQLDASQRMAAASAGATPRGAMDEATMRAEMEKAAAEGGSDAIMAVARKYGAVSTEDFQ